jgi:hypothetical protein
LYDRTPADPRSPCADGRLALHVHAGDLLTPGDRLDEAGTRQGRGLLIARDLAEATNDQITMHRSVPGGLQVSVSWSTAEADPTMR